MRNKRVKAVAVIIAAALFAGSAGAASVEAVEFTVTKASAVLYSNANTKVYPEPDVESGVITTIESGLPVEVTGITSNGWFVIELEGTYYVPGNGLQEEGSITTVTSASSVDVTELTKGTFSFYKSSELSDFTKSDVEDMDENTYLKYLDSYLRGYGLAENCILKDSGKKLSVVYASESETDANVAAMSVDAYLINYRNSYLSDSLVGPFRTQKSLKLALNRAIRYDVTTFGSVYKSTSVGSDEDKMTELLDEVIGEIEDEQGVTFTCKIEYGDYTLSDGTTGTGWLVEFTKKE